MRGDSSGETPEIINELWNAHRSGSESRLRKAVKMAYNQGNMTVDQIAGELKSTDTDWVQGIIDQPQ